MNTRLICCIFLLLCEAISMYQLYSSEMVDVNPLVDGSKVRYVARVAYDGSRFHGWQSQPVLPTVQGRLSSIFSQRFGSTVKVIGASRTDVGVHAHGQTIHFDVPAEAKMSDLLGVEASLNKMLSPDIYIYNVSSCPIANAAGLARGKPFHSISSTCGKAYTYRLCTNRIMDPFTRHYYGHMPSKRFQYPLFHKALQLFVGTHDFNAFSNLVARTTKSYEEEGKLISYNTTRTVYRIDCEPDGLDGYYLIRVYLKSAVYRMVRNIIGTSVSVATGQIPIEKISHWFTKGASRDENIANSAPAEGLLLEHVFYDHYGPDLDTYVNACCGEGAESPEKKNYRKRLWLPTLKSCSL